MTTTAAVTVGSVLVVAGGSAGPDAGPGAGPGATDALVTALVGAALEARVLTDADPTLLADEQVPDLVFVAADVDPTLLPVLRERCRSWGRPAPVLYGEPGGFDDLAAVVSAGWDCLVAPFHPPLLGALAASAAHRGALVPAGDAGVAASLRRYEHELRIAHEIQSGFLPERLPTVEGWTVAAHFRPAREVGGDFYDVFELMGSRRLGFVVADVCDKGVGAALFMALIRTLVRFTAEHVDARALASRPDPEVVEPILSRLAASIEPLFQAVDGTNRYMVRNHLQQGYFATMFFGVLDPSTGTLVYINAGHNPPVLVRASGESALLDPTGPAVGILPDGSFSLGQAYLDPGDRLFVYTDGVVEARDAQGAMLGLDAVRGQLVTPAVDPAAPGMVRRIVDRMAAHVGDAVQFDDITMLAVARDGAGAGDCR